MYILYGGRFTRALIVEMVLAEGDIAYQLRQVDIIGQAHRSPEFLAINPAGRVPAMITPEGETLYETPAINLFLADRHGLSQLAPQVEDPARGLFLSGLFFLADELEPMLKRYFYPHRYVLRDDDTAAMRAHALAGALDQLAMIDRRLEAQGPYHLGDRFSLVDLTLTFWAVSIDDGDQLAPYPALRACMALVMDRPKLKAKFAEQIAWRDDYAQLEARGEGVR